MLSRGLGVIQELHNAVGVGGGGGEGVSDFLEKLVMKMYGWTLLALGVGGWVSNFQEKSITFYVTLVWPPMCLFRIIIPTNYI